MNAEKYVKIIKKKLRPERFEHSLRVRDTALEMAGKFTVNLEKVALAALLHDYAKDMSPRDLLDLSIQNGLLTCEAERMQPDLLHGPVAAWLCQHELGISDTDILQAIRYHTTGYAAMTLLDKIVYLADLIEPGRRYNGVAELRKICEQDMYNGLLYAFDCTLLYIIERKMLLHPLTIEARNQHLMINNDLEESYEQ